MLYHQHIREEALTHLKICQKVIERVQHTFGIKILENMLIE